MAEIKASKRSEVAPFLAMDVLSRAAALEGQGRSIIHMEVGQPGAPLPSSVLDRIRPAFETGRQGYTEALGIASLRQALSAHYRSWYDLEISPERFVVTTGSTGGFTLAFLCAFEAGARIGLPTPGYPAYRNIMSAIGIEPVTLPAGPAEGYVLTVDALESAHRDLPLNGLLIASPNNPTGSIIEGPSLAKIIDFCEREGITLISDEIYHGLTYGPTAHCALEFSQAPIVVSSFSKYFCMTGWRVGWMVVPETLVRPIERVAQSLFISVPELSQVAGVAALENTEDFAPVRESYARNRLAIKEALPKMGLHKIFPMDGAFYSYVDISDFGLRAADFAARLLEEAGVAVTPGMDFDPFGGERYIRLSYAGTEEAIREGLNRLGSWIPNIGN